MGRYRVYTIEFKKQVVQEYLGGESLHALGKRHQISRNLIRIWIAKYEAGEFNDDQAAADMLAEYEARIALLERKVGQLTLENDLLKKTLPPLQSRTGDSGSVISGPVVSALRKGAGS
jgi:transposase